MLWGSDDLAINTDEQRRVAKESGYADAVGSISSLKKADLVNGLIRHFANADAAAEPTPAQRKAREWLPHAMLFPAIDPSAPAQEAEDEEPSDDAD